MHRNIAWDKVENPETKNTPQVPPSFEEATPPVTHPEKVKETIGTPIEVEPLNETKLEEVGLNCNHNTPLSSREVPSFDGPESQPLLNSPSLDVVDYLTTQTPPSPHMSNSHPKGVNCNHNTPLSSREVPSFDGPESQPLLNSPSLDVVDYLTTQTPPSPHMSNSSIPKGVYSPVDVDDDRGLESMKFLHLGEEP
ncbi:hypothetical protein Tco_0892146 [Tanacetum coccineum]|uniref:Uncharacterized protein n=1 Tax=Tanacetum coccineum TaxID=301880 RepID=A0ABQ5CB33_9ASTR